MTGERQPAEDDAVDAFTASRRTMMAVAYRMLGSVSEAEDAVQDAWLRWQAHERSDVAEPRAFLARTVARLCLDRMKSARVRREQYVGAWLPEPVLDEDALFGEAGRSAPDAALLRSDELTLAVMVALERLSPGERAAFLLHDVFDLSFADVAATLERSEAACRQLAARARRRVRESRPRYPVAHDEADRVADAFMTAVQSGDVAVLRGLLAADAVLHADGGGKAISVMNPILGGDRIARFFAGLARKFAGLDNEILLRTHIDGLPGFVTQRAGDVLQTTAVEILDGRVVAVYVMRNPDKLARVRDRVVAAGAVDRSCARGAAARSRER